MKIIKATDALEARNLVTTIFGDPGLGKTTLSFTMPTPLHCDFDRGVGRAVQLHRPDTVVMDTFDAFYDFVMGKGIEDAIEESGYQSIILDTIGTLLDNYAAPYLIKRNPKNGNGSGGLGLSGWGNLGTLFNSIVARLQSLGLEIGMVCHAKEVGDDNNRRIGMAIKGGSTDIVYRVSDMMGYIYMRGENRVIDFNPTQMHLGKNTAGIEPQIIPNASKPDHETFQSRFSTKGWRRVFCVFEERLDN